MSRKSLEDAYKKVRKYENSKKIRYKEEMRAIWWGTQAFRDFKAMIHISDVIRIIKKAENWDEVIEKTLKL